MTKLAEMSLETIREQIAAFKQVLTDIEKELDEIEQRQASIKTRAQEVIGTAVVSPIGQVPIASPAPKPKYLNQKSNSKK